MIDENYKIQLINKLNQSAHEIERYIMEAYPVNIKVRHDICATNLFWTDDVERNKEINQNDPNSIYAIILMLNVDEYRKWILSKEYKKLEEKYLEYINQLEYLKEEKVILRVVVGCFDSDTEKLQYTMVEKAYHLLKEELKKQGITLYRYGAFFNRGMKIYVIILFGTNNQLKEYVANGLTEDIKEAFIKILDQIGYSKKFIDGVEIDFDTKENETYKIELVRKLSQLDFEIKKYIMDAYPVNIIVRHSEYRLDHLDTDDFDRYKIANQKDKNMIFAKISFRNVDEYRYFVQSKEYKKLEEKYFEFMNQQEYLKDEHVTLSITIACFDQEAMSLQYKMKSKAIKKLNRRLRKFGINIYKTLANPFFGMKLFVIMFFETNRQLKEYEESGMTEYIKEMFRKILDEIGYTKKFIDGVSIEFDTDENVQKNYAGSYYYRSL